MSISDDLRGMLLQNGATAVGYGDLSQLPENCRRSFGTGISIAISLSPRALYGIDNGSRADYYFEKNRLNNQLDELGGKAKDFLISRGYEAFAQTTTNVVEEIATWKTILPHKTVATRAGLGWIGNCALLVTENFGSAIRITSVLTHAPLETASPVNVSRCGVCTICRDVCPGKAVSGKNWSSTLEREEFFDAFACRKAARERGKEAGFCETLCGLCILKCPWTQKYLNRVTKNK